MKIQISLFPSALVCLLASLTGACSTQAESAPAAEVEIPSQDAADAVAADAINEANADQVFADLEKEIQGDL